MNEKDIFAGIIYSSVESRYISNVVTRNVALSPAFFDEHYALEETFVYVLTHVAEQYILNPINRAILGNDGQLNWQFDFQTMKNRIISGLLLHGEVHEGIIESQQNL